MNDSDNKKKLVYKFLEKGILISPKTIDYLISQPELLEKINIDEFLVLTEDICNMSEQELKDVNWDELDKLRVLFEKQKNKDAYLNFIEHLRCEKIEDTTPVKIITSYTKESKKRDIQDFVSYFTVRYKALENILRNRQELQNVMSINRLANKRDKEEVAFIGLVTNKKVTANGNIMMDVEDPSGIIKVLVSKNKKEVFEAAKDIVLDEALGIVGACGDNIVFVNNILWPDVPLSKEIRKSPDEVYSIFLSDIHVGSDNFLEEEFNQFLDWINGKVGNEKQKDIAKKVKYIFIIGDLIDGVGIYPGQELELTIKDAKKQYEECANLLSKIPRHIKLIICAGNHDAMRIAEPQPQLYKDFAEDIWKLPNAILVSNPSLVNIHSSSNFPGFDVLLYHGYSFDYYVANVENIRNNGGYERADLIMKFLLQRRHLAPTHTSTLYIPEIQKDPLVIDKLPDFFVTGHIHSTPIISNYKNITTLSCGCWQAKTPFQEKVGHNPGPCKFPIINLQTREIKILNFEK